MKSLKIMRVLGFLSSLALLVAAIPSTPARADWVYLQKDPMDRLRFNLDMLESAQPGDVIRVSTFIFNPDATGYATIYKLVEAARRGVEIHVMVDHGAPYAEYLFQEENTTATQRAVQKNLKVVIDGFSQNLSPAIAEYLARNGVLYETFNRPENMPASFWQMPKALLGVYRKIAERSHEKYSGRNGWTSVEGRNHADQYALWGGSGATIADRHASRVDGQFEDISIGIVAEDEETGATRSALEYFDENTATPAVRRLDTRGVTDEQIAAVGADVERYGRLFERQLARRSFRRRLDTVGGARTKLPKGQSGPEGRNLYRWPRGRVVRVPADKIRYLHEAPGMKLGEGTDTPTIYEQVMTLLQEIPKRPVGERTFKLVTPFINLADDTMVAFQELLAVEGVKGELYINQAATEGYQAYSAWDPEIKYELAKLGVKVFEYQSGDRYRVAQEEVDGPHIPKFWDDEGNALHMKAVRIGSDVTVIRSQNDNLRSRKQDKGNGILIESAELAQQFDTSMSETMRWREVPLKDLAQAADALKLSALVERLGKARKYKRECKRKGALESVKDDFFQCLISVFGRGAM